MTKVLDHQCDKRVPSHIMATVWWGSSANLIMDIMINLELTGLEWNEYNVCS